MSKLGNLLFSPWQRNLWVGGDGSTNVPTDVFVVTILAGCRRLSAQHRYLICCLGEVEVRRSVEAGSRSARRNRDGGGGGGHQHRWAVGSLYKGATTRPQIILAHQQLPRTHIKHGEDSTICRHSGSRSRLWVSRHNCIRADRH